MDIFEIGIPHFCFEKYLGPHENGKKTPKKQGACQVKRYRYITNTILTFSLRKIR